MVGWVFLFVFFGSTHLVQPAEHLRLTSIPKSWNSLHLFDVLYANIKDHFSGCRAKISILPPLKSISFSLSLNQLIILTSHNWQPLPVGAPDLKQEPFFWCSINSRSTGDKENWAQMCFERICRDHQTCVCMATGNLQNSFSQILRDPVWDLVVFIAAHFLCLQCWSKLFI